MEKLKNKKTIMICAAILVAVLLLILIIWKATGKDTYRMIKVKDFAGSVEVARQEEAGEASLNAFEGMRLLSQDVVTVKSDSFLELLADDDKHIGAEADTGFSIYADGSKAEGKLRIELLYGKALFTIDNKLSPDSSFEVETSNAALSVRGTKFSVAYDTARKETTVEVFDGTVWLSYAKGSLELIAGMMVIIRDTGDIEMKDITGEDGSESADNSESAGNIDSGENRLVQINLQYLNIEDIEGSYHDTMLFIADGNFLGNQRHGYYTNAPNVTVSGGGVNLSKEAGRIDAELLQPKKADIDKFFIENRDRATELYAAGNTPEAVDVTDWFPQVISIESEDGTLTYNVTRAEMVLAVNAITSVTAADGTTNAPPPHSFIDGNNYSAVHSVNFFIYGY